MKSIILTGGGTAGHVTPNLALLPSLLAKGVEVHYIGSETGIEKKLVEEAGIPYYAIASGKLRRYFSLQNFTDPFRILKGYFQVRKLIRRIKPDLIFSKGGFVTVPVVIAGKQKHVPVILHESDMTPGLANRIALRFATKICISFPETISHLPKEKAVLTGAPIRQELFRGDRQRGLDLCGFDDSRPVLLVIGGSLGAKTINEKIYEYLPTLLQKFQIIHICGEGKLMADTESSQQSFHGYRAFTYVKEEYADLLAAADVVISRAGANSICELLALHKPNLLIPLPAGASRGDQLQNAASFEKQGFSRLLYEEDMTLETLQQHIDVLIQQRERYIMTMASANGKDAVSMIVDLLEEEAR